LVTFSGDKLLGGPQCGLIVGSAELIARCERHPLMRALRPGRDVVVSLQETLLKFLSRTGRSEVPFWAMATEPTSELERRADQIVTRIGTGSVVETIALIGAGSTPGMELPSFGVSMPGDRTEELRSGEPPIIARCSEGFTVLDLRTVSPVDDPLLIRRLGVPHNPQ
jgi:L-seryl-tRNA(Ser) seleniumtransferase